MSRLECSEYLFGQLTHKFSDLRILLDLFSLVNITSSLGLIYIPAVSIASTDQEPLFLVVVSSVDVGSLVALSSVGVNRAIHQPLLPLTYVAFGHRSHRHPYPSPFASLEQMTKRVSTLCFVAVTWPTSLSPGSGDWRMVSGVDGRVV